MPIIINMKNKAFGLEKGRNDVTLKVDQVNPLLFHYAVIENDEILDLMQDDPFLIYVRKILYQRLTLFTKHQLTSPSLQNRLLRVTSSLTSLYLDISSISHNSY